MLVALALGLLIGFVSVIPPDGPAGALVIDRALHGDPNGGWLTGIGSGIAEGFYSGAAFLGISAWFGDGTWFVPVSEALAAGLLLIVGLVFALRPPPDPQAAVARQKKRRLVRGGGHLMLGFAITALNPTLIVTWAALTAMLFSLELVRFEPAAAPAFGGGVGTGVALWYLVVTRLIQRYREKLTPTLAHTVTRVVGWGLVALALYVAVRFALAYA